MAIYMLNKKHINIYLILIYTLIFYLYRLFTIDDSIFTFISFSICTFSFYYFFKIRKNFILNFLLLFLYFLYFIFETSYYYGVLYTGSGFTDSFFYHLRLDIIYAGFMVNIDSIIMFLLIFSLISYSFYKQGTSFSKNKLWLIALVLFLTGILIAPSSQSFVASQQAKKILTKKAPVDLSIFSDLDNSRFQVALRPKKKPNVVLIYAESLDARFFDEQVFPGLMPGLKELRARSVDFVNLRQGVRSGWTMGGIVASQCGYPLLDPFGIGNGDSGNNLNFLARFMPKAECFGDFFRDEGYRLTFMGGADTRFGGKDIFLHDHGYDEVLGRAELEPTLPDPSYLNWWGIYDDTLLDRAFSRFNSLSSTKKPFVLTLLTVDTHPPRGFKSESCQEYNHIDNSMLNSSHCTDFLLTNFINKIRKTSFSKNTIIVVVSDHLSMRNAASPLLKTSTNENNLTFFINYPDQRSQVIKNQGLQYDIAPTILQAIGYSTDGQLGLGKSLLEGDGYLVGRFGVNGWQKYEEQIVQLAINQWDSDLFINDTGIEINLDKLALKLGGQTFDLRSEGVKMFPPSFVIIMNKDTLKIEKINAWPSDRNLEQETISNFLRNNPEKLYFAMSRRSNLINSKKDKQNDEMFYAYGLTGRFVEARRVEQSTKISLADFLQLQH